MKRLLLSILAIFLVIGLVGTSAFAWFQDTETSTGNTFTAGTLDLKVRDNDETTWADGVTATWTLAEMKPGHETNPQYVDLLRMGSIAADHVEVRCDYTINDPLGPESDTQENTPADHMADYMIVTSMIYYNLGTYNCLSLWLLNPASPQYADDNTDAKLSLKEFKAHGLDNLDPPNGSCQFEMKIKFDENAGNNFQGDTLEVDITFTLNQDSSQ